MSQLTRRRFLGTAAALAGTTALGGYRLISPARAAEIAATATLYPPSLTGLRGDHDSSRAAPHSVALRGRKITMPEQARESYDLVVVGSGISGLTAAYAYRKARPQAKILIVDNHDDFGGHAKRNEFTVDGKTLITYGGSENLDSPEGTFSPKVKRLVKEIGIDYKKFAQYFQQDLYRKTWGLKQGVFFGKDTFGEAKVVAGQPETGKVSARAVIGQFPLSDAEKAALTELYVSPPDYLKGKSRRQRSEYAATTSYYDFLRDTAKLPEKCLAYLQNISSDYWGHDIRAVSVAEAWANGYPGLQNCRLPAAKNEHDEPYIYHFPDGNASVARLLVRRLIPDALDRRRLRMDMENVVLAKTDYTALDKPDSHIKIRLNTTALLLENQPDGSVAVALQGKNDCVLYRVSARKCIYAGHAALAQRIVPQMPQTQQDAMRPNVKVPMVYTKVALKNARAFQKLGVYHIYAPNQPYCELWLDYPVKMGGYTPAQTPDEPIVLHCVRIATAQDGKTARDKYRAGRQALAAQDENALRGEILTQLRELFALAGENADDIVADLTINRWAHGYSYERVGLFDSEAAERSTTRQMQRAVGNIFMANSDVAWQPYLQHAMEQGLRAAEEVLK